MKKKLYIICFLSLCISIGLGVLILQNNHPGEMANHTPTPSLEPSTTPSPTPMPTETPDVIKSLITVTDDDSVYRMVNKQYTLSEDYVPADLVLCTVSSEGEVYLVNEAADALSTMFQAASEDGVSLYLISGYRSYSTQLSLYNTYLQLYGQNYVDEIDCIPGTSEHQLGLSVDLGQADHKFELDTRFDTTDTYRWLSDNSWKYGFIARNPMNSQNLTGIVYSPWNFRYVGNELARVLHEKGMIMEQYYDEGNIQ